MDSAARRDFRAFDSVFVILVLFLLLLLLGLALPKATPTAWLMAAAAVTLPIGVVLGIWIRRRSVGAVLAPGRFTPGLVGWTVFGSAGLFLALMSLAQPFLELFPKYKDEIEELTREVGSMPPGFALLMIGVLAPLGEEMVFRGALLKGFRNSWGAIAGLLVSSTLFALAHGIPPRMIATFLIGMWLGGLAMRTGGLAIPLLAHALNNTLVLAYMYLELPQLAPVFAAPGAAAFLFAAWRLFRPNERSMQGSAPPGAS
ncbi:MAG TPA: type II CAAX endopeptidase family protein [Planctomycetota bacterium]|nr:type II CAAX endopeptidase family protein [Planctomycetota bacterium]